MNKIISRWLKSKQTHKQWELELRILLAVLAGFFLGQLIPILDVKSAESTEFVIECAANTTGLLDYQHETSGLFSFIRDRPSATSTSSWVAPEIYASTTTDEFKSIERGIVAFDLESAGVTTLNNIIDVTLRLRLQSQQNTFPSDTPSASIFQVIRPPYNFYGGDINVNDFDNAFPLHNVSSEICTYNEYSPDDWVEFPIPSTYWENTLWVDVGWAYFSVALTHDFTGVAPTWSSDKIMSISFYGAQEGSEAELVINYAGGSEVITLAAVAENPDRIKFAGMVVSLGRDTVFKVYIDYGFNELLGETLDLGVINKTGTKGYFKGYIDNVEKTLTYYHRARAVGVIEGEVLGEIESFSWAESGTIEIETLKPTEVLFTTAEVGLFLGEMGVADSLALSIDVGTDDTFGTNVEADPTATAPAEYKVALSGLDNRTVYLYRAKAVCVDPAITVYGEVLTFETLDPSQPRVIQNIQRWLGISGFGGSGFWWLLVAGLCAGTGVAFRKHKVMATAICICWVGAGLALAVLDSWLLAVLAVIASAILVVVFIRKTGGA